MDFSLTDEQRIIVHTAQALFKKQCALDVVKAAWAEPEAAHPLWRDHLRGWLALSAAPLGDSALFMEEYGRALAPGVFFASLLAACAAAAIGVHLEDTATIAVAASDGYWVPHDDRVKHFVPSAAQVRQVVVVGGAPRSPSVAILPIDQVELAQVQQMDQLRPQYRIALTGDVGGNTISPHAWQRVVQQALVTCAAELVGVGRHLLDSAVQYAKERQQFGRPIGAFQGLQWKLVDAALELERAAAAVAWAAMCVDAEAPEAARAAHCAKLEAGTAARRCARTSLQVHGGIGYTWEHGLHFWLRRAYSGDAFMGTSDYHARCVAELLYAA